MPLPISKQQLNKLGERIAAGEPPDKDDLLRSLPAEGVSYPDGSPVTRQRIIYDLRSVADQIAGIEDTERSAAAVQKRLVMPLERHIVKALGREIVDLEADAALYYPKLRASFKRTVTCGVQSPYGLHRPFLGV